MIELSKVRKSFEGRLVLDGVSLALDRGETFVIIGMSGTGKTVTLKHVAGLLDPDEGDVLIGGVKMNGAADDVKERLRMKMGIVFQSGALINWLTVFDNVALPLVERRLLPDADIEEIVDEKLRLLGLSEAKHKMPGELSGGMKKRVCLARVLVRNPEIILYDEPTAGLDPVMSRTINNLIRQMKKDFGVTSMVVTHDMHSAYDIADRIAMLYNGSIIQCDVPEKIRDSDNPIVRQFVRGMVEGPIAVD
ncbi:MAG TPA: ATP-binding cassette domain-containing protein [Spirochaetota bacterium]|nr:ATP-binding cassette domain-containing protein [Spirochaetota bacterium]HPV43500.1 ATP-binding cassette domain-containing protein [Spirochaetota bacterium]